MASLDEILEQLSPENIAKEVSLRFDLAREKHQVRNPFVESYGEFRQRLVQYYTCLIEAGEGGKVSEQHALAAAWQIIESSYPGGVEGAYRDACGTGENGAMIGVFNRLHEKLKRDAEQRYTLHVLRTKVNALSFDEQVDLCRQYLKRFGNQVSGAQKRAEELARDWQGLVAMLAKKLGEIRRETTKV